MRTSGGRPTTSTSTRRRRHQMTRGPRRPRGRTPLVRNRAQIKFRDAFITPLVDCAGPQGPSLSSPGLARRRRGRAAADTGAAGGPRRRLPPPRGEHVRGLRGRRPAGRRLPRLGCSRFEPLPVSVQAFPTCERPAFGTRPPRHALPCLPAFLFVTVLRPNSIVASMASRGEHTRGRREPAVCTKGIIMQRKAFISRQRRGLYSTRGIRRAAGPTRAAVAAASEWTKTENRATTRSPTPTSALQNARAPAARGRARETAAGP